MRVVWALTFLAVVAADVSHLGYNYKAPQTSFGIPSYQLGGSSNRYSGYVNSGPVYYKGSQEQYLGSSFSRGESTVPNSLNGGFLSSSQGNLYSNGYNSGYGSGLSTGSNTGYVSGLSSGLGNSLVGSSGLGSGHYYQTVGGPSTVQPNLIYHQGSNEYQTSRYGSGLKSRQFYQVQSNEPAQVFKHFYVHTAPEEPELPKSATPIVIPPPQKHYKIIFIKTNNVDSSSTQVVPVQPPSEEKTIVYVLVKKPEEHNEVIVPKVEQKPPTKPEVFFVKYENKEDSQALINNIVQDYNKDGQSVSYSTGASPVHTDLSSGGLISGLSDVPTFSGPSYPSGVSNGFLSSSGSSHGSSFSTSIPSTVGPTLSYTSVPTSLPIINTGSNADLYSDSISDLSSGSVSGLSSGSNSGFTSGSITGISSGSGLSNLFPSSQSGSSVQIPIVSSSANTQSFGSSIVSDSSNDDNSSFILNGSASPTISSTNLGSIKEEHNSGYASQGLPHESYGVPKFRAV